MESPGFKNNRNLMMALKAKSILKRQKEDWQTSGWHHKDSAHVYILSTVSSEFDHHLLFASSIVTYCANNTEIAVFRENNCTYFHQAHPTMRRLGKHYAGETRVALHAIVNHHWIGNINAISRLEVTCLQIYYYCGVFFFSFLVYVFNLLSV